MAGRFSASLANVPLSRKHVLTRAVPRIFTLLTILLICLLTPLPTSWPVRPSLAAMLPMGFAESLVAGGMPAPTAMAFAPDGRIFVCEKAGNLRVIQNGSLLATPFLTVSVNTDGERGLIGVAIDPNFATNNFIYIYYTPSAEPVHNRLSRFTASGNVAASGSEQSLLELPNLDAATHNGGAIHFGPDGKLYVAVGDNGVGADAQSLDSLLGKILRLNANPADL